jgi:hypothetical protein
MVALNYSHLKNNKIFDEHKIRFYFEKVSSTKQISFQTYYPNISETTQTSSLEEDILESLHLYKVR